jgi:hypothetical protein
LDQDDIEEFYFGYQYWHLLKRTSSLEIQIADMQRQIADNMQRIQEVQPTAIALATLARLQSNGVSDMDLLDRMLEQGELWLDRTMQRLEYFEQLDDFISDDYTQWCQRALDGAYDWIDSMLGSSTPSSSPVGTSEEEKLTEATEELFLEKLSRDEYEDESALLEPTLKRPAITIAHASEPPAPSEEVPVASEVAHNVEEASPAQEENFPGDTSPASPLPAEAGLTQEYGEADLTQAPEEGPPVESSSNFRDTVIEVQFPPSDPEALEQHQKNETLKRPNSITRFMGRIWGSQA